MTPALPDRYFGPWDDGVHTARVVEKSKGHCGGGGQDETSGSF